jgi:peptidoglycan/xylan/chitin deacetylase (PgdA/CDA1 family)
MKKILAVIFLSGIVTGAIQAQDKKAWNGYKCAVVLTYDDGLNVHLDKVIPSLDSVDLKGTFYIPGNVPTISNRMDDWRMAAANGHELGNHTLFHPCSGSPAGREWVSEDYDLDQYTTQRFLDEIRVSNTLLKMIDGKNSRTFAYTCGDMMTSEGSFYELMKNEFVSARGVVSRYESLYSVDIYNTGAFMIMGQTGEEMIDLVKEAIKSNALLVFLFHGVGGEHNIDVSLEAHNMLLGYLKAHEQEIWVAPFMEISDYIKKNQ